jgi:uncharacterized protein (DUF1501 family)
MMNRRNFLAGLGASAVSLPLILEGFTTHAFADAPLVKSVASFAAAKDRILVLVQLGGGNDGVNTLVPLDQLSDYYKLRKSIALPERSLTRLTDAIGLHPSFAPVRALYDEGKFLVVNGVSYPSVNQSHFRSTDIWFTASDHNEYLSSGWLGRFVNHEHPAYPSGYPNPSTPDPLALEIGGSMSLTLQGHSHAMGVTIRDLSAFEQLVDGKSATGGAVVQRSGKAGARVDFIREIQAQAQKYSGRIKEVAERARNKAEYPDKGKNPLADQLQIVARLIAGGLQTRIYVVNLGGFDTHWDQTDPSDVTKGVHADLLRYLAEGMATFQRDLKLLGLEDRVLGMTISEFGRRPLAFGNGTDHGAAGPMFLFGAPVRAGVLGVNSSLTDLLPDGNLKMQYDFRQIYASVLAQWFLADERHLSVVLPRKFDQIPLVQQTATSVSDRERLAASQEISVFPNPCSDYANARYVLPSSDVVRLSLHDALGGEVLVLLEGAQQAGAHRLPLDASRLPAGTYLLRARLTGANRTLTTKLNVVR